MQLSAFLEPYCGSFISITGGGGKTSLMSLLGRHFRSRGRSVLLTTTTKVMSPRLHDYGQDTIFGDESVLGYRPRSGEVVFYAEHSTMDMKKWIAPREEVLAALAGFYDVVIAEADGSRGLPLKVHTDRDPVINPLTDTTIAVMGLWGIGDRICSSVFGDGRDGDVGREYLQWYIDSPEGLAKGMAGRKVFVFNGADSYPADIIRELSIPQGIEAVIASVREDRVYG